MARLSYIGRKNHFLCVEVQIRGHLQSRGMPMKKGQNLCIRKKLYQIIARKEIKYQIWSFWWFLRCYMIFFTVGFGVVCIKCKNDKVLQQNPTMEFFTDSVISLRKLVSFFSLLRMTLPVYLSFSETFITRWSLWCVPCTFKKYMLVVNNMSSCS